MKNKFEQVEEYSKEMDRIPMAERNFNRREIYQTDQLKKIICVTY